MGIPTQHSRSLEETELDSIHVVDIGKSLIPVIRCGTVLFVLTHRSYQIRALTRCATVEPRSVHQTQALFHPGGPEFPLCKGGSLKKVTYAGESVLTSDDVASALVELTAALACRGVAEAASIPICEPDGNDPRTTELVIGVGNDVLAVPIVGECGSSEFDAAAAHLRERMHSLNRGHTSTTIESSVTEDDLPNLDYDGI